MHKDKRSRLAMAGPAALAAALAMTAWAPGTAAQDSVETEAATEVEAPAAGEVSRVVVSVAVEQDGRVTDLGTMTVEFFPDDAPQHVENFLKLVEEGFYAGTTFHRIVPGFIVQGGDPISRGDWRNARLGTGGPSYTVPAEIGRKHVRGAVAAARKPDAVNPTRASSGSQFYICLADLPSLDRGGYTVFGQVVEGMDVVDAIVAVPTASRGPHQNVPAEPVVIQKAAVVQ